MTTERFDFTFDPRFRLWLMGLGITPRTTSVTVSDDRFVARFGPWVCETDRTNITGVEVSGPYRWYKAIGPRLSAVDRGLTFGSTAVGGVCVKFREPVKGLVPTSALRHPGLTVTVRERERLAALLGPSVP